MHYKSAWNTHLFINQCYFPHIITDLLINALIILQLKKRDIGIKCFYIKSECTALIFLVLMFTHILQ